MCFRHLQNVLGDLIDLYEQERGNVWHSHDWEFTQHLSHPKKGRLEVEVVAPKSNFRKGFDETDMLKIRTGKKSENRIILSE